jgi:hypothetical protein
VVAHTETLVASDHPVCAASVASRHLLTGAATPPLEEVNVIRIRYRIHRFPYSNGAWQTKFFASSVLPVPVYVATFGYAQSGRLRAT